MKDSIHHYMRFGVIHFMAYPEVMGGEGPILETLSEIAYDADFTAVEIAHVGDPEVRRQAGELCAAAGLTVAYAAQPAILGGKLNLNSLDETERQRVVKVLEAEMRQALDLGAGAMAVLSGPDPGPDDRPAAADALVKTLQELCDLGRRNGVRVTLETFDRDIDKRALIGPSEEAAAVAQRVDRDNFGLIIDLSHLPLQRETPREALGNVADHLVHAHFGNCVLKDPDNPAYGDLHPRFGYPGSEVGVPELTEYLRVLLEMGFLNPEAPPIVSAEVKPMPGETGRAVIANAKRVLREAWARV